MVPKRFKHLADFVWQLFFGSLGAALLFALALALAYAIHWMWAQDWIPPWLIYAAMAVEVLLVAADVFLFVSMVLYEVYVNWTAMFSRRKRRNVRRTRNSGTSPNQGG